jgi:hypothetical protein
MEFSDIQPVSQSGQLQPTSVSTAADLSSIFNSRANAGDQIEMFLAIAEGQPDTAITSFSTVVRNLTSPPIKALALQGFGRISQPYKQALALCASKESQELLKLLCNEIRNRSSALTTWAAAEALREMGFPLDNIQHPQGGNLSETPRRIQNEVLEHKIQEINRIQRLNSQGAFTADYERFLEFWVYGPTSEFFNQNLTTSNYVDIVKDILHLTQIRGVRLGLNSGNSKVQDESFRKIKSIFKQYSDSKDNSFKKTLANSLNRFIKAGSNEFNDLQKLAKVLIFKHSLGIDFEKSELNSLIIAKMKNCSSSLERYCSEVSSVFKSAINVSSEPVLNRFLENDLSVYLQESRSWIKQFKNQIDLVEAEQNKVQTNISTLGKSFEDVLAIDREFFNDKLNFLHEKYSNSRQLPQTYEECQLVQNKLRSIKDKLLSDISARRSLLSGESRSLNNSFNFEKIKEEVWSWIGWGITILVGTYIFSSIFVSCSSSNSSGNTKSPAWYETGYPKEKCGHSSSNNRCWYPVFTTYTDSNWNQIVHNCRDVPKAQSQSVAKQRKQIQIASFNNEADAKGFVNFMDTYYDGTPWIGQQKCY